MAAVKKHVPLTPGRVKAFRYDSRSRDIRWDTSPKAPSSGFGLRIYPSGKKAYVLQYRPRQLVAGSKAQLKDVRRKVRLVVIGAVDKMDLSTARAKGLELLLEIQEGIDPKYDAPVENQRLGEFVPTYLKIKTEQGVSKTWLYNIERRITKHLLPRFGNEHLTAIKRSEILKLFMEIGSGGGSGDPSPIEANKVLTHVSNIYREAEICGAVPKGTANPTRLIKRFEKISRKRFLTDEETKRLYPALATERSWHTPIVIQILLHQGMRKQEVLGLRWQDVNLDRVSGRDCVPPHLFVGRTKNGIPLHSVLSPQMIDLFTHLGEFRTSEWVFPSPKKPGCRIADIKDEWRGIREEAGISDVNIRDLRHCVGTWLGRLNHTELVIGRILNHRTQSVTERYSLLPNETKEEAVSQLADWIQHLVGPPILRSPVTA